MLIFHQHLFVFCLLFFFFILIIFFIFDVLTLAWSSSYSPLPLAFLVSPSNLSYISALSLGVAPMPMWIQLCLRTFNYTLTFLSIAIRVSRKMQATNHSLLWRNNVFFSFSTLYKMHMMINISLNLLIETWI